MEIIVALSDGMFKFAPALFLLPPAGPANAMNVDIQAHGPGARALAGAVVTVRHQQMRTRGDQFAQALNVTGPSLATTVAP